MGLRSQRYRRVRPYADSTPNPSLVEYGLTQEPRGSHHTAITKPSTDLEPTLLVWPAAAGSFGREVRPRDG